MDVQDWIVEGGEIVRELQDLVPFVALSGRLNHKTAKSHQKVYINLETSEHERYTIMLSLYGFKVIANQFDTVDEQLETENRSFETIYSLLQSISPQFQFQFNQSLAAKLCLLKDQQKTD